MSEKTDGYREWLGAYADGELTIDRRAWLETHLATCPVCQQELRELRALSTLLHADPLPAPSLPADRFAAQVVERLPHTRQTRGQHLLQASLRYLPLGLFAAYAFFQAVIWLAGALLLALNWLPGGGMLGALLPASILDDQGALTSLLGLAVTSSGLDALFEPVETWLAQLPWTSPLGLVYLSLIFLLGMFFCTWLAVFWSYNRMRQNREVLEP